MQKVTYDPLVVPLRFVDCAVVDLSVTSLNPEGPVVDNLAVVVVESVDKPPVAVTEPPDCAGMAVV